MSQTYLFGPGRPELQDRIDIEDLLSSFVFFIDNREFARARELFAPDATVDYSRLMEGSSPDRLAIDFMNQGDPVIAAFDATQHMVSNFDIRVDGDTATCRAQFCANHWIDGRQWTVWGTYRQKLVRAEKGWRIQHHQCRPLAQGGDLTLPAEAMARV